MILNNKTNKNFDITDVINEIIREIENSKN